MIPSDGCGNFDGVEETNNGRKEDVEVVVQVGAEKLNGAQKLRKTKSIMFCNLPHNLENF